MASIILSEIAQNGVKDAVEIEPKMDDRYKEVMREADEKIREDHANKTEIYRKASSFVVK